MPEGKRTGNILYDVGIKEQKTMFQVSVIVQEKQYDQDFKFKDFEKYLA